MIRWNPIAGWMGFPYLSRSQGITHSYTLTYKLTDKTGEAWTSRLIRFKNKDKAAIYGAGRLLYGAVPGLIKAMAVNVKDAVFVAALSSGETQADPDRAIPYFADQSAGLIGARCDVGALSKNIHEKIHNLYSAEQRDAELEKAEYKAKKLDAEHIFVFDDFITRGATLSKIASAILEKNPKSKVYGLALAKAERVDWCPNPENDQVSGEWDKIWQQGEEEAAGAKKG
ncbi:hypothetical protein IVB36_15110 [Bradyrhizobium sp. 35]|uniref:hypothetical protein n=1 Tax=Bradyrhizobium sp. 35 TaxID=2782670 RepID=UPI001FFAF1BF|nr:hypothetical protein [Bradyrhizobium sp. 35]MCK1452183.1 hypothetical protein [Bradyrhizobium sp. 35]